MPNTFTLIASSTVGAGGASSIDFTSIPATYTDLLIKICVRSSDTPTTVQTKMTFNGSATSYSSKFLYGSGSGTASGNGGSTFIRLGEMNAGATTSSTFTSMDIYIPNYTASQNKSVSADCTSENNATEAYAWFTAGLWSNTSAINQVTFAPNTGSFVQYSTAYLYGVKNA